MSMDPGLQAFEIESAELLEQMEQVLLILEDTPEDEERINELFRAVHTIKGSAGLFGFDDVVSFTHHTETLMEMVRGGEMTLNDALIGLLLQCRDQISTLVDQALNVGEPTTAQQLADSTRLQAELDVAMGQKTPPPVEESANSSSPNENTTSASGSEGNNENWHISLRFGIDVLRQGMDPMSFLRYLSTVGDIVQLVTVYDHLPAAADMDPEACYLGFEIGLRSSAEKDEIEAVFEFVLEDCTINILPPNSRIEEYIALINTLPEENLRVGEILRMSGALTGQELQEALTAQASADVTDNEESEEETSTPAAPPLGDIMVDQGAVPKPVVEAALAKQAKDQEKKSKESQMVRVSADKLEELINLVGELVISGANTRLLAEEDNNPAMMETTENMSRLVEDIRDTALGLRMVQIGTTFNRYRRTVRELSRDVDKEIKLRIHGGDTELDKTVVEKISDPLMHLVRNSIDHGVESPARRKEMGKRTKATVTLSAHHDSGMIVIEVSDDGQGLPRDKILAKAIEKDLVSPDQELTDQEVYMLIFEPGFSTAEKVTNISGRGVGMDVVRRNVEALRGFIEVDSTPGKGSTFRIRLPLTLAIIDGFQVRVGGSFYILPLDLIEECLELRQDLLDGQNGGSYINMRGDVLPFLRLDEVFHTDRTETGKPHRDNIVIVHFAGQKVGLVVDELLGEYQTVIKPMGQVFQHLSGISGATILGSGEVAMIIDIPALVQRINKTLHNRPEVQKIANA